MNGAKRARFYRIAFIPNRMDCSFCPPPRFLFPQAADLVFLRPHSPCAQLPLQTAPRFENMKRIPEIVARCETPAGTTSSISVPRRWRGTWRTWSCSPARWRGPPTATRRRTWKPARCRPPPPVSRLCGGPECSPRLNLDHCVQWQWVRFYLDDKPERGWGRGRIGGGSEDQGHS